MTQITLPKQTLTQWLRLEEELESHGDELARLSPFLKPKELSDLDRRWQKMRKDLDAAASYAGIPIPDFAPIVGDVPALAELETQDLYLVRRALHAAKQNIAVAAAFRMQAEALVERSLKLANDSNRLHPLLEKLKTVADRFQKDLSAVALRCQGLATVFPPSMAPLEAAQDVLDQTRRIAELERSRADLKARKSQMQLWLRSHALKAREQPRTPMPSPPTLKAALAADATLLEDSAGLVDQLVSGLALIREARRYLEFMRVAEEQEEA